MVFYGEYSVSFTTGGRLVLPKKIREQIKGSIFILTKGFDNCLSGYDKADWEKRSEEFMGSSLINTEKLNLRRLIFSGAVYIELDEQGRFVLPKNLMDYLGKTEKATFVGAGDHFEIWTELEWQSYINDKEIKVLADN
jgi:MraZ protein